MSTWDNIREIAQRLVITGDLHLLTPAHLGNGDAEGLTDMSLCRDPLTGKPLLLGTSIAGALRNYLRAYEHGHKGEETLNTAATQLFGSIKGTPEGDQSSLVVNDALADSLSVEIRDGVQINDETRTAEDKKKYDLELLPAGTCFPLRFELRLPKNEAQANQLKQILALALRGLERAEIAIGARRSRGFGRCRVSTWQATMYNLCEPAGLIAWLTAEHTGWKYKQPETRPGTSADLLGGVRELADKRQTFQICATFALDSALFVRSTDPLTTHGRQPDHSHIRSSRIGTEEVQPVLPGTSLAGALRSRARRVLKTLKVRDTDKLLNGLFGAEHTTQQRDSRASRLIVEEACIEGGHILAQSRVAIDRFTGGAFETALFSEAPQFGGSVKLLLTVRDPQDKEKGLLLLLLKDLWTADLPLGGTSSVGHGRLCGHTAVIQNDLQEWKITAAQDNTLTIEGDTAVLEEYVQALCREMEQV